MADITIFDLQLDTDGDFKKTKGLGTAIQMSFHGEKRADDSEVKQPELRRGWIGNELAEVVGYEIGSKLWLLSQERNTEETLNRAIDYTRDGFKWMISDKIAKDVIVSGERDDTNITINIEIQRYDNKIENVQYRLWQNTDLEDIDL